MSFLIMLRSVLNTVLTHVQNAASKKEVAIIEEEEDEGEEEEVEEKQYAIKDKG